jgi:hypothetical protein
MDLNHPSIRSFVILILLTSVIVACQRPGALSPDGEAETDGGAGSSQYSGEAGTATLRIERSGMIIGEELQWEVAGEFPITLYFDPDDTSPIFWSQGEGTAVMTSVDASPFSGITMYTTAIWDVEFEVRGAFNAQNCSIDLSVKEVWAEGAEVHAETSDGHVLEGITEEFIIFTTNSYEYNNLHFPYGVGEVNKVRNIGNVDWDASFTITSLVVPEVTNCGTFEYGEEDIGTPDVVD